MLIYVRLLCPDFKFRTFFWAAVYVECGTAQGLFECIEAHCEAMDVPIEKIFFYASDGASVVSSDRGGLAGLLRARSAVLTSTHCLAHREALGMKDAVEQSELTAGRRLSDSVSGYRGPQAGPGRPLRHRRRPGGWRGRDRKMRRSSGCLSGQILGL